MKEKEAYELWRKKAVADDDLIPELVSIEEDADGIFDRFYKNLEFGTAGLRGVIGAGTNRMNVYTIGAATQGLADYLSEKYEKARVAIADDSRIKSDKFAREAASILAANGIEVYIYPELMPTPMLSFAVRQLKCQSGIVVTASHNPSKYNGYKCYGPDGCQMTSESADAVYEKIKRVDYFTGIHTMDFEDALDQGKIHYIGKDLYDLYLDKVMTQQVQQAMDTYGRNELRGAKPKTLLQRFFAQFADFMVIILIIAAEKPCNAAHFSGHACAGDHVDAMAVSHTTPGVDHVEPVPQRRGLRHHCIWPFFHGKGLACKGGLFKIGRASCRERV